MKKTTSALRKMLAVSISVLAVSALVGYEKATPQETAGIQRAAISSPTATVNIERTTPQDLANAIDISRADQAVSYRHSSWSEYIR